MTSLRPNIATLVLVISLAGPASAQWDLLPGGQLPRPVIEPREPHMGIRLIGLETGASAFGSGIEWEANFGHMIPFVRVKGDDPAHAITLGVQGGVFGRFAFETRKRDLISSDWVFAAPVFFTNGADWVRVRYRHISAHLGDDYIDRFLTRTEGYLRDDIGVVIYRQIQPGVALYGGGDIAFNVDPNQNRRLAVNGGIEFNTRRTASTPWYGGMHVHSDQDVSWKPRINVHAGTRIAEGDQGALRFTVEVLHGPSPQQEFRKGTVRYLAVGLIIDLR